MASENVQQPSPVVQAGIPFPAPLADKYRPRKVSDFLGLEKPKKIMLNFIANPRAGAFLFSGPSGVGKSTMALALCEAIQGELIHIPFSALQRGRAGGITRADSIRPYDW